MTEKAGKNRSDYKRVNRGLVLKMVATGQCTTRQELVHSTGLSKMGISNIVTELMGQDLIVEAQTARSEELGRRPASLDISPAAPKVVGLSIGRDRCEAVLCDLKLRVLQRERGTMENMDEQKLIHLVYQLLDTILQGRGDVIAIGLSCVGPISVADGMILKPFYFFGIQNVHIVDIIRERYHLPVFFDHDNQSAVLAESLYGNGRGYKDILFVGVAEGVGCGILADGQLYCNRRGLPPELGHVSVDIKGRPCECGNRGCVETYLRTSEMLKKLRYHTGKFYTYETFSTMTGDPMVKSVFEDAVNKLATAIVSIINILNSELILLGNSSAYWHDEYLAMLEDIVNRRRFVDWDTRILVKRAYFLQDAALMGAACNALVAIFAGNMMF